MLAEALAGREAEKLVLGDAGNGSAADLRNANALADRAAADWGFSRRGARTYYGGSYPGPIVEDRLDRAATEILLDGEALALRLLEANRAALEHLTAKLEERHYADSDMLREWLSGHLTDLE